MRSSKTWRQQRGLSGALWFKSLPVLALGESMVEKIEKGGKKVNSNININDITNIKNIHSKITQLMNPHEVTCNKILSCINNYTEMTFSQLRDLCYDIFIYNLDIYECIWYILRRLTDENRIPDDKISDVLISAFNFFKYYNNNYRPIYHLENYILYLLRVTNGLS